MGNCAVVGGQAWLLDLVWLNGITFVKNSPPYQAIALDYGTVKNGAWIVTNRFVTPPVPTDMEWAGPDVE
jgi:hypothetical protein